ncbi:MAG: hypothetical protein DMG82_10840 [Acidobacteria bacterium]|nr:MAG: hypothetical protein DMG82_10840 [Acidobacteriota bacterium]
MESTEPVRLAEVVAFWILAEKRAILGKSCFDSFRFDSGGDGGSNGRQWLAQVKSYFCVQKCGNLWKEIRIENRIISTNTVDPTNSDQPLGGWGKFIELLRVSKRNNIIFSTMDYQNRHSYLFDLGIRFKSIL